MRKTTKIIIILWFIFSWAILIIFTLKPIGAISWAKILSRPIINYCCLPDKLILSDFESTKDFYDWRQNGVLLSQSKEYAYSGSYSAKIVFVVSKKFRQDYASIMLENYDIGPKGQRDWSYFKFLKFIIFNPQGLKLPLYLKIKDVAGRAVERIFDLKEGENRISLNLEEIAESIDLHNIAYLNLYFPLPAKEAFIYLDRLCLEKGDLKQKRIMAKPVINFIKLSCPRQARRGSSITVSCSFSTSEALKNDYRVFIHIINSRQINKKLIERKGYINADHDPWVATSRWQVNTPYDIGPISIYIPKDFSSGEYFVQIGLFNLGSYAWHCRFCSAEGMMDFRGSYPRLRYVNPKLKDYTVGKIQILD